MFLLIARNWQTSLFRSHERRRADRGRERDAGQYAPALAARPSHALRTDASPPSGVLAKARGEGHDQKLQEALVRPEGIQTVSFLPG